MCLTTLLQIYYLSSYVTTIRKGVKQLKKHIVVIIHDCFTSYRIGDAGKKAQASGCKNF